MVSGEKKRINRKTKNRNKSEVAKYSGGRRRKKKKRKRRREKK